MRPLVEVGISSDFTEVGEVGSTVLFPFIQVIESTPSGEFLVGISVASLKRLDQLIDKADVGFHERVNQGVGVRVQTVTVWSVTRRVFTSLF